MRHLWIALAAVVSFNTACRTPPPPPVSPDTWAVVGGEEITRSEVEKAFRRMETSGQPPSDEEALAAKLSLLDEMIVQEILLAKARELKIEVADTEVDAAFNEGKKNLTPAAFEQELARRQLTEGDMREGVRRELLSRKLLEREVISKVTVTDQQVTDYFNANRSQFNLPEDAFHLAQIVVTATRDPQLANRTGDDAATPQAATAKVAMLMERLKGNTAFADLARDFSEDPESAPRGGDLGIVPMSAVKQAPPALRDVVLQMTPGNARVVNQGGNYTIVFVVSREPAGQRDLSTPNVKERITQQLKARREQLLRSAYLAAARTDAEVVNYLARRVVESQGKVP